MRGLTFLPILLALIMGCKSDRLERHAAENVDSDERERLAPLRDSVRAYLQESLAVPQETLDRMVVNLGENCVLLIDTGDPAGCTGQGGRFGTCHATLLVKTEGQWAMRAMGTFGTIQFPDLVTEHTPFEIQVGGRTVTATPAFQGGQGKNMVLSDRDSADALALLDRALEQARDLGHDWEVGKIEAAAGAVREGASVPISNLTLLVQRAFGGLEELDWQSPARLWVCRGDGDRRTILELDGVVRDKNR